MLLATSLTSTCECYPTCLGKCAQVLMSPTSIISRGTFKDFMGVSFIDILVNCVQ